MLQLASSASLLSRASAPPLASTTRDQDKGSKQQKLTSIFASASESLINDSSCRGVAAGALQREWNNLHVIGIPLVRVSSSPKINVCFNQGFSRQKSKFWMTMSIITVLLFDGEVCSLFCEGDIRSESSSINWRACVVE